MSHEKAHSLFSGSHQQSLSPQLVEGACELLFCSCWDAVWSDLLLSHVQAMTGLSINECLSLVTYRIYHTISPCYTLTSMSYMLSTPKTSLQDTLSKKKKNPNNAQEGKHVKGEWNYTHLQTEADVFTLVYRK